MSKHTLLAMVKLSTIKTMSRIQYRTQLTTALKNEGVKLDAITFLMECVQSGYTMSDGVTITIGKTAFNKAITNVTSYDNPVTRLQGLTKERAIDSMSSMEYHDAIASCLDELDIDATPYSFLMSAIENGGSITVSLYLKEYSVNWYGLNDERARRLLLAAKNHNEANDVLLSNAFSFNMVPVNLLSRMNVTDVTAKAVPANARSVVGHADTANVISGLLKRDVPFNRESVTMSEDTVLYVAQYNGPRLEEGATSIPHNATMTWVKVWFN